jgi:hypothetical protein
MSASSQPSRRQQRYDRRASMPLVDDAHDEVETVTNSELKKLIQTLRDDVKGLKDTIVDQGRVIANLSTTVSELNNKIETVESAQAVMRCDIDVMRVEIDKLKKSPASFVVSEASAQDAVALRPGPELSSKPALAEKLCKSAEVLYLSDSNSRAISCPAIGRRCGRYVYKEMVYTLEEVPSMVRDHPSNPSIVVVSCLINTIENFSDDGTCTDKLATVQSLYSNAIKAIHDRWPECQIVVENSPWILAPATGLRRADTEWSDGLVLELTEPQKVTVANTDWEPMLITINGKTSFPGSVYADCKHLGPTGISIRQNNLIRALVALGRGDSSRVISLGPVFSQLRSLRSSAPLRQQQQPPRARASQPPWQSHIHQPFRQPHNQQRYETDFPNIQQQMSGRMNPAPAPTQPLDITQILRIYEAIRVHNEQINAVPANYRGGYADNGH